MAMKHEVADIRTTFSTEGIEKATAEIQDLAKVLHQALGAFNSEGIDKFAKGLDSARVSMNKMARMTQLMLRMQEKLNNLQRGGAGGSGGGDMLGLDGLRQQIDRTNARLLEFQARLRLASVAIIKMLQHWRKMDSKSLAAGLGDASLESQKVAKGFAEVVVAARTVARAFGAIARYLRSLQNGNGAPDFSDLVTSLAAARTSFVEVTNAARETSRQFAALARIIKRVIALSSPGSRATPTPDAGKLSGTPRDSKSEAEGRGRTVVGIGRGRGVAAAAGVLGGAMKAIAIGATAAAAAVTGGVVLAAQQVDKTNNKIIDINKLAIAYGAPFEWMSALSTLAERAGMDISDLRGVLAQFQSAAGDAARGGSAGEYFKILGIDVKNAQGQVKTLEELLDETFRAMNSGKLDASQRAYMGSMLFGEDDWAKISELTRDVARTQGGLRGVLQGINASGRSFSDEDLKRAQDYRKAVAALSEAWTGFGKAVTREASVTFAGLYRDLGKMIDYYGPGFAKALSNMTKGVIAFGGDAWNLLVAGRDVDAEREAQFEKLRKEGLTKDEEDEIRSKLAPIQHSWLYQYKKELLALQPVVKGAMGWIGDFVSVAFGGQASSPDRAWMVEYWTAVTGKLKAALGSTASFVADFYQTLFGDRSKVSEGSSWMITWADKAAVGIAFARAKFDEFLTWLAPIAEKSFERLGKVWTMLGRAAVFTYEAWKPVGEYVLGIVTDIITQFSNGSSAGAMTLFGGVAGVIGGIVDYLLDFYSAYQDILTLGKTAAPGFEWLNTVRDWFDKLSPVTQAVTQSFKELNEAFKSVFNFDLGSTALFVFLTTLLAGKSTIIMGLVGLIGGALKLLVGGIVTALMAVVTTVGTAITTSLVAAFPVLIAALVGEFINRVLTLPIVKWLFGEKQAEADSRLQEFQRQEKFGLVAAPGQRANEKTGQLEWESEAARQASIARGRAGQAPAGFRIDAAGNLINIARAEANKNWDPQALEQGDIYRSPTAAALASSTDALASALTALTPMIQNGIVEAQRQAATSFEASATPGDAAYSTAAAEIQRARDWSVNDIQAATVVVRADQVSAELETLFPKANDNAAPGRTATLNVQVAGGGSYPITVIDNDPFGKMLEDRTLQMSRGR